MSTRFFKQKSNISAVSSLAATFLMVISWLVPFNTSYAESTPTDTITINLKNVDIHSFIETVASRTGKNFIVDPRVKATISVISSEPVDGDKLYDLFLSVLQVHGFAAIPAGNFIKIVPATAGLQGGVPVLGQ